MVSAENGNQGTDLRELSWPLTFALSELRKLCRAWSRELTWALRESLWLRCWEWTGEDRVEARRPVVATAGIQARDRSKVQVWPC